MGVVLSSNHLDRGDLENHRLLGGFRWGRQTGFRLWVPLRTRTDIDVVLNAVGSPSGAAGES